jgi:phosphate uptake regulator
METRKVQVTGGSTFTVSLPKEWATAHEVSAGSVVAFYPEDDTLVLRPRVGTDPAETVLDVSVLEGEELVRALVAAYVSGFDLVTLEGAADAARRRTVRRAVRRLVGLEVVEETERRVRLRYLLDSAELSVHDATTRMSVVATGMLEDAMSALVEGDTDLAADVRARDDDVDRLRALVLRSFRTALRDPAAATRGLDTETCFDYQQCSRQYERVADHAEKIAGLAGETAVPASVESDLIDLHDAAVDVLHEATEAFLAAESDSERATRLADRAGDANAAVRERARALDTELRATDAGGAVGLGLVVDSLSRVADYGGNVAEVARQRAAPRP